MKFWFGFSYDEMKAVDFFSEEAINPGGKMKIGDLMDEEGSTIDAICAVCKIWEIRPFSSNHG